MLLLVSQFSSGKLCAILNSVKHLKTRVMPKTPCIIWTEHASMAGNSKLNSPGETGKVSLKNCSCGVLSFQCCKFYAPLPFSDIFIKNKPMYHKKIAKYSKQRDQNRIGIFQYVKSNFFQSSNNTFIFIRCPCRVGLVVSMSVSHRVGREFASRLGHTKDHHKNGTNCLPAWHVVH